MPTAAPSPQPPPTARVPVLVVDDEYGPRESVAFALSNEFEVQTSDRAKDALAKIAGREFSAVILDVRMPEMDGIRALEEIRKIDPLVSVIMLTGYGTLHTAQQAMVGGANQYLRKPPDIPELLAAVRAQSAATALRRRQARLAKDAEALNAALKQEMALAEPQIWKGRASVELVHDLNNPLTVVIGYATLLVEEAKAVAERDPELGRKLLDYAGMVEKAAEYCHHISESWRRASKKLAEMTRVDLVQIATDVQHVIFFGNLGIGISGLAEAPVIGSKFELMRIFQNLYKNAIEAGGRNVSTQFTLKGDRIEVAISDDGPGMGPESLNRALKGGYTNKESGTGLGLGICRHLVAAHGGTFDLQSEIGKGTVIRLSFPAVQQA